MKRGKILNFVLLSVIILFFLSFVSAFSLTGKVISVSPTGWAISFVDTEAKTVDVVADVPIKNITPILPEETTDTPEIVKNIKAIPQETVEEVKEGLERDNRVDVIIDDVEVTIKKVNGAVEFDDGTKVQTEEKLTIEEGKISVEIENTLGGTSKDVEIKILPSKVANDLKDDLVLNEVETVELKISEGAPYYEVKGKKKTKLFGFIPISRDVTIEIDATSGKELKHAEEQGFFGNWLGNLFGLKTEVVKANFVLMESRGYLTEEEQVYASSILNEFEEEVEEPEELNNSIEEPEDPNTPGEELIFDVVVFTSDDFNKESNVFTANVVENDCLFLTQTMVDSTEESDVEIYFDGGCVAMNSDLNMGNKTLIVRGGVTFDCDGYNLLGSGNAGIYSYENTFVKNCVITGRNNFGFRLHDASTVENSLAEYNEEIGFKLEDNSYVLNSTSRNNERGFKVGGGSTVEYSTAIDNNLDGFWIYSSATVANSVAENNWYGLRSQGSSHIIDSVAINNHHGFSVQQSSDAEGSTAIDSVYEGFSLSGARAPAGALFSRVSPPRIRLGTPPARYRPLP